MQNLIAARQRMLEAKAKLDIESEAFKTEVILARKTYSAQAVARAAGCTRQHIYGICDK
jgi:hypothetical protein